VRDDGHLPATAAPRRYALSLHIDPSLPRFSGSTRIEVDVPEPTSHVVLNALDLHVVSAAATVGGETIAATTSTRAGHGGWKADELVLTFARPLPAGQARIDVDYDAAFGDELKGLYRVEDSGRRYAFTQFEAADARRAFPCFDEPGFKTPYEVTITTPAATMALANTPETGSTVLADGSIEHHFAPSPPLPSYLVAFAVGEFDIVEWQKEPFSIRAVTTKGHGTMTGLALEAAAALVAKLGDYFAFPYPYAKLDLVAVPDFGGGAMENPGLVTFRDSLLLLDPRRATTASRRALAVVIAHELAHQWLGDLVTMRWWDDVWLNEGFATWAEAKVVDAWRPSFGATLDQIAGVQGVMDTDAMKSARAVREPVRSRSEAEEAFDGITYDKGAAVLRMIESWLGPDVFRRGVQRYLHENAWKTATAHDLFDALDYVSTQRVEKLANGFLDQPGVPEVNVRWSCDGPSGAGRLVLSASEWRPVGSDAGKPRDWMLPVCVESDALKGRSCFTLGREPITRDLGGACPTWIYPNADLAGYYRFALDGPRLVALARNARGLSPLDRLGIVSNAWAEVRRGAIDPSVVFDILPAFDHELSRHLVSQIAGTLQAIDNSLVDDGDRDLYERWVAARMAPREQSLGWEASPNEDEDRTIARRTVLWTMGEIARDPGTLEEADSRARMWLRDPTSVPEDVAAVALPLASLGAGAARLHQLRAAAAHARAPEDRILAIRAMGAFDDPDVLRKALDLAFTDELKLSELRYLFGSANGHQRARSTLFAWEKENWDRLRARLPGEFGIGMLIDVAGSMCTRADRDDARDFFAPRVQGIEGTKRHLDEALEAAGLCVALREEGAQAVTHFLKRR
jgi:alanyl aminopeptidase